jgi:hypothetical protein
MGRTKINITQKNNSKRSTPKSNKTIINLAEYNKALVERGVVRFFN